MASFLLLEQQKAALLVDLYQRGEPQEVSSVFSVFPF